MATTCSMDGGVCVSSLSKDGQKLISADRAAHRIHQGTPEEVSQYNEREVNRRLEDIRANHSTLGEGSKGFAVRALQRTLNDLTGSTLKVDGDFAHGGETAKALKAYQTAHRLPESGRLDQATLKAMDSELATKHPDQNAKLSYSKKDEPICMPVCPPPVGEKHGLKQMHAGPAVPSAAAPLIPHDEKGSGTDESRIKN